MIDPTSFELVFDATIALSVQTEIAIVAAVYEVYDLCVCVCFTTETFSLLKINCINLFPEFSL